MTTLGKLAIIATGYLAYRNFIMPGEIIENKFAGKAFYRPSHSALTKILYAGQLNNPQPFPVPQGKIKIDAMGVVTEFYNNKVFIIPNGSSIVINEQGFINIINPYVTTYYSPYPHWFTKEQLNDPSWNIFFELAKTFIPKSIV